MEYNKKRIAWLVIFMAIYGSACKTSFPSDKKNRKEKVAWQSVLNKSDTIVKKYWLKQVDGNVKFLNQNYIQLTEADLPKLKLFPFPVYTLDSIGILAINNKNSIGKLFMLEKNKAVYYGLKDDTIKVAIHPQYVSNTFSNGDGYSNVFPLLGRMVSTLISKHIEFYQLDVIAFPSSKSRLMSYLFYVNNKEEFISLQPDGSEVSLKGLLVALRQRVLEIQKKL